MSGEVSGEVTLTHYERHYSRFLSVGESTVISINSSLTRGSEDGKGTVQFFLGLRSLTRAQAK